MNNLEVIQGKVFDVIGAADAVIAQMAEKYLPLKINGIDDKSGYKAVHEARMIVKSTRVKVEKHGKDMREDAVKYQKAVIAEEKRIIGLMEPVETHLAAEEKAVDDAAEAIKQAAALKEAARIQARIDRLESDYGMGLFGQNYKLPFEAPGLEVPLALLKVCTDEQFEQFCGKIQAAKTKENLRLVEIEKAAAAESERLARVAAEQDAERQRLETVAQEQANEERKARMREKLEADERERKEAEIRAAQKKIDDEKAEWERIKKAESDAIEAAKQKAIDDEKHAVELEKARQEAALKAIKDLEEKAKREAREKAEKECLAKIAAEKKEARRPDKEKIVNFADAIGSCSRPEMKTQEGAGIMLEIGKLIDNLKREILGKAATL